MTPADELLKVAASVGRESAADLLSRLDNLDSEPRSRTHDWRNHLPRDIVRLWGGMSLDSRLVAFILASIQAKSETWD